MINDSQSKAVVPNRASLTCSEILLVKKIDAIKAETNIIFEFVN